MLPEDIIEGPIKLEEPGTFLSNLVITEIKGQTIFVLHCEQKKPVTHKPIPTVEELQHELSGSDVFSVLDMTNYYYQLYAFCSPWGIF